MNKNSNSYYSILYAIIGDIIGFGNGHTEFNYGFSQLVKSSKHALEISAYTSRHIFDFIYNGGFSGFKINNFKASDDSVLLLAVFDGVNESLNKSDDLIVETIKNKLVSYYINDKDKTDRYYGNRTILSLERIFEKKQDWKKRSFSSAAGGCGASIRCMPIGLFYSGVKNREKLMNISIESSRVTHNNPIGYLGGFASALFTALAIEKIHPEKWIKELIKYFEDDTIYNYIKNKFSTNFKDEVDSHINEANNFYEGLLKYYKWTFTDDIIDSFKDKISMTYLPHRNFLFYKKFGDPRLYNPGANGLDSILIAYDSLLQSQGNFEKLIYLSMLHAGDSDSTGCIAGAFFGAYYGNINLPDNLTDIEFKNQLNDLFNN